MVVPEQDEKNNSVFHFFVVCLGFDFLFIWVFLVSNKTPYRWHEKLIGGSLSEHRLLCMEDKARCGEWNSINCVFNIWYIHHGCHECVCVWNSAWRCSWRGSTCGRDEFLLIPRAQQPFCSFLAAVHTHTMTVPTRSCRWIEDIHGKTCGNPLVSLSALKGHWQQCLDQRLPGVSRALNFLLWHVLGFFGLHPKKARVWLERCSGARPFELAFQDDASCSLEYGL